MHRAVIHLEGRDMVGEKPLVYVIEDEEDIAHLMKYNLSLEGYEVRTFPSGEAGLKAVYLLKPQLIILDLMLPGRDGLDVCRQLKQDQNLSHIPVMMVTAKGEESDVVAGLELGADDYLTKPFSPKVLAARSRAILRRSKAGEVRAGSVVHIQGISIHPGRHEVKVDGEAISLTRSEFEILYLLARKPGWVFTRMQIVDAIRGDNYAVTDRSIDFQMVGLRKKMGPKGDLIETVRGVGYRFKEN